jgi:hypothetical protein
MHKSFESGIDGSLFLMRMSLIILNRMDSSWVNPFARVSLSEVITELSLEKVANVKTMNRKYSRNSFR